MASRINSRRGEVVTAVLLGAALVALVLVAFKPKALDGESRRAKESKESTAQVITATATADEAVKKRSAAAAASVVVIAEANSSAPASPEKDFIAREAPVALANLEAPDPKELLAARDRKIAVMEGQLAKADQLYGQALKRADQLVEDRDKALRDRDVAFARRDEADRAVSEAAAAHLATTRQRNQAIIVAVAALALWLYTRWTRLSSGGLAAAVKDIRAGTDPIVAIDTATTPLQQWLTSTIAKLRK